MLDEASRFPLSGVRSNYGLEFRNVGQGLKYRSEVSF